MKNIYISLCLLVIMQGLSAQTLKHGIIFCGGTGNFSGVEYDFQKFQNNNNIIADYFTGESKYKMNVGLGYKFRIIPEQKSYFFDLSLMGVIKRTNYTVLGFIEGYNPSQMGTGFNQSYMSSGDLLPYSILLDVTGNYKIFKGLYAGAGLAPSFYFQDSSWIFDLPPVAKIGWDLKYVDIAIVGRMGLLNTLASKGIKKGRINDLQIQLFIPF